MRKKLKRLRIIFISIWTVLFTALITVSIDLNSWKGFLFLLLGFAFALVTGIFVANTIMKNALNGKHEESENNK